MVETAQRLLLSAPVPQCLDWSDAALGSVSLGLQGLCLSVFLIFFMFLMIFMYIIIAQHYYFK